MEDGKFSWPALELTLSARSTERRGLLLVDVIKSPGREQTDVASVKAGSNYSHPPFDGRMI
jgi:hypothetical protein